MKKNTHPQYQKVLFVDSSTGQKFLIGSTLQPKEKENFDGKDYPFLKVSISASSHPFFVGGKSFVDTEGRVEKFTKRYQAAQQRSKDQKEEEEKKEQKAKEEKAK